MEKRGKTILILGYLALIIIGLMATIFVSISSILTPGFVGFFIAFIIFISTALLTYTYFSNFNFKESTTLYHTLAISIVLSGIYYLLIWLIMQFLIKLQDITSSISTVQFGISPNSLLEILHPENILITALVVIPIILIVYNIFPIIFLIKNRTSKTTSSAPQ